MLINDAVYWMVDNRWMLVVVMLVVVMLVAWIIANLMIASFSANWIRSVVVIDIHRVVFFICCAVFFVAGVCSVIGWVLHFFG